MTVYHRLWLLCLTVKLGCLYMVYIWIIHIDFHCLYVNFYYFGCWLLCLTLYAWTLTTFFGFLYVYLDYLYFIWLFVTKHSLLCIELRTVMGNVSKKEQLDQKAEKSRRPRMGEQKNSHRRGLLHLYKSVI